MFETVEAFDPKNIVDSYAEAVSAGRPEPAERAIRLAAYVGRKLRETVARCDRDLSRAHEGLWPQIREEQEAAQADIKILEAVPALQCRIEDLNDDEVADIWDAYGNPDAGYDDVDC